MIFNNQEKGKVLIIGEMLILVFLFMLGGYFIYPKEKLISPLGSQPLSLETETKVDKSEVKPSPTPFPFQEITIPYLKSRSYQSNLGTRQLVSQNESYTSYLTSYLSDGLKINAQLTMPAGSSPEGGWPAIVFVHGYIPPQNYRTLSNYSSFVDYLARQGFVIFKIDLRGHGDSEGESGGGYYSSDYIIDTLNAYSALENSGLVNPKKVGLWGHSMAGNVVARALAAKPDIPAIVIWAGAVYTYTDLADYSITDTSYQPLPPESTSRKKRSEMIDLYGSFNPASEFWRKVPMTNYLEGINGAILLNHAVDDSVVDIRYSRNFDKILDQTSIKYEIKEYPTGGHNFTGPSFTAAMQNTVEFFNKYLTK